MSVCGGERMCVGMSIRVWYVFVVGVCVCVCVMEGETEATSQCEHMMEFLTYVHYCQQSCHLMQPTQD